MSLLRHAGRFGAVAVVLLSTLASAAAPSTETTSSRNPRCEERVDAARENTEPNATYDNTARASKPGNEEESNWGPFCEARLCMSDSECACGWRGGYCDENSVCQYN